MSGCSENRTAPVSLSLDAQIAQGKEVYEISCVQCHYEGSGSATAPNLIGSTGLADPESLAHVILAGRQGESMQDGKKFGGIMPPQAYLRDDEIAAVIAYVRATFGAQRESISNESVAGVRASLRK